MALIRTSGLVGQISGRIGANVWSHNRYGMYVRQGTIPITSTTEAAIAAKTRLAQATQLWQGYAASRRLAWKQWALNNPTLNRLGQSIQLTGHAAFVGVYCRSQLSAIGIIEDPPVLPADPPLFVLTLAADIGPGDFAFAFTATPTGADSVLWIRAAVCDSAGINYIENILRWVGVSGVAEATGYDPQAQIEAVFGALEVGNIVHAVVSVYNKTTGLLSAPMRCQATVVDTTV